MRPGARCEGGCKKVNTSGEVVELSRHVEFNPEEVERERRGRGEERRVDGGTG